MTVKQLKIYLLALENENVIDENSVIEIYADFNARELEEYRISVYNRKLVLQA